MTGKITLSAIKADVGGFVGHTVIHDAADSGPTEGPLRDPGARPSRGTAAAGGRSHGGGMSSLR